MLSKAESVLEWVKRVLSDHGEPSASRVLMFIFSFFTMGVLMTVLHHMYYLADTQRLGMWLDALPYLIFSLASLIVLPYTVNSGRGGLTDIAQIIGQMKSGGKLIGTFSNQAVGTGNPTPSGAPAAQGGTGSDGEKG
jgi:hypothetical protein